MYKHDNCDDFESMERDKLLVTYNQADLTKFQTRKSFGKSIKDHFNAGKVKIEHWACCREDHEESGQHYHVALKISGQKRWKTVKENFTAQHGVVVNFSDKHDNYYSA